MTHKKNMLSDNDNIYITRKKHHYDILYTVVNSSQEPSGEVKVISPLSMSLYSLGCEVYSGQSYRAGTYES